MQESSPSPPAGSHPGTPTGRSLLPGPALAHPTPPLRTAGRCRQHHRRPPRRAADIPTAAAWPRACRRTPQGRPACATARQTPASTPIGAGSAGRSRQWAARPPCLLGACATTPPCPCGSRPSCVPASHSLHRCGAPASGTPPSCAVRGARRTGTEACCSGARHRNLQGCVRPWRTATRGVPSDRSADTYAQGFRGSRAQGVPPLPPSSQCSGSACRCSRAGGRRNPT